MLFHYIIGWIFGFILGSFLFSFFFKNIASKKSSKNNIVFNNSIAKLYPLRSLNNDQCIIFGICGPSCSGKTTVCLSIIKFITDRYGEGNVTIISQDSYYFGGNEDTNFDHPSSIDFNLLGKHIEKLKKGETIQSPVYDFTSHSRKNETKIIKPAKIIIVEGILIFSQEKIRDLFQYRIFINASPILMFVRRRNRDVNERGRTEKEVITRYLRDVEPSFHEFIEPAAKFSHLVLVNNEENQFIGLTILLDHITMAVERLFAPSSINNKENKFIN